MASENILETKLVNDSEEFVEPGYSNNVMNELQKQRFSAQHLCDATLRATNGAANIQKLKAHKSVLAACSEYFKTLFTSKLSSSPTLRNGIVDLQIESNILTKILNFMYTGKLRLSMDDAQDMLAAADYLCIDAITHHCSKFLHNRITLENCICVKFLAEKYNLKDLGQQAVTVATTSSHVVFDTEDALDFPVEYVLDLLKDPLLNYINEQLLFKFAKNWVNYDFHQRHQYFRKLFACLEPSYLPRNFLRECATTEPLLTPDYLEPAQYAAIFGSESPLDGRNTEDVILCRSRSVATGDQVALLCYHILKDKWTTFKLPANHTLDGLESMIHHNSALYFLVSKVQDMFGYMHHTPETKHFWRCDLRSGHWEELTAPSHIRGTCRLVSHINGVYVIDRSGRVEEFDVEQAKWTLTAESVFDCTTPTMSVLPMPMDRYMYLLRVFSSGYSFNYSQISFSLHRLDTVHGSHRKLSEIDASELDIEEKEHMFGYNIKPGQFTLTNELGRPRIHYSLVGHTWTSTPCEVSVPRFVSEVWGSVPWQGRVYFVGRTKKDTPIFMFYDIENNRFKATVAPPTHLSGILCHVVAGSTELNDVLIQQQS